MFRGFSFFLLFFSVGILRCFFLLWKYDSICVGGFRLFFFFCLSLFFFLFFFGLGKLLFHLTFVAAECISPYQCDN